MVDCYVMVLDTNNQPLTNYYPARIGMQSEDRTELEELLGNLSEIYIDFPNGDNDLLDVLYQEPQEWLQHNLIIAPDPRSNVYNCIKGAFLVNYCYGGLGEIEQFWTVETKWRFSCQTVVTPEQEIEIGMRRMPLVVGSGATPDWNGPTIRIAPEPFDWSKEGF